MRAATGEDLADRFARIAAAHGWDLHLRVAADDLPRVADVVPLAGWPGDYLADPRWGPALGRPPGLLDADVVNSERFRTCSFPAIALHASARGLARFYADLLPADGPVAALLGPDLHAAYVSPAATGHDGVLDREVTWTLGFQVDEEDLGMGGAGGCAAWWSLRGGYAAAYVTRGLGDQSRADGIWEGWVGAPAAGRSLTAARRDPVAAAATRTTALWRRTRSRGDSTHSPRRITRSTSRSSSSTTRSAS